MFIQKKSQTDGHYHTEQIVDTILEYHCLTHPSFLIGIEEFWQTVLNAENMQVVDAGYSFIIGLYLKVSEVAIEVDQSQLKLYYIQKCTNTITKLQ